MTVARVIPIRRSAPLLGPGDRAERLPLDLTARETETMLRRAGLHRVSLRLGALVQLTALDPHGRDVHGDGRDLPAAIVALLADATGGAR